MTEGTHHPGRSAGRTHRRSQGGAAEQPLVLFSIPGSLKALPASPAAKQPQLPETVEPREDQP